MVPPEPTSELIASIPYLVVADGEVVEVGPAVAGELGCDPAALVGPLGSIGTRLDDATYGDLLAGRGPVRVRLPAELGELPVRLRRLAGSGQRHWVEIRSLADEFRLASLLRRSGSGHMLVSPSVEVAWAMTSNELADIFPGDDPMTWVELMDPADMRAIGEAIVAVAADPATQQTVTHRLRGDHEHTVVDTIESALHDPDLRAILVRSRLTGDDGEHASGFGSPYAGATVSDHMPIGVIVASTNGKVLHRNAVAAELVGAGVGQMVVAGDDDPGMLERLSPEDRARFAAVFGAAVAGTASHCTIASPTEERCWLRLSASPAWTSTVVIAVEDATELAETERALRASNRLLEALDSHSEDLVLVFDAIGRSRYTSSSVGRALGDETRIETTDDIVGLIAPVDRAIVSDLLRRVRSHPAGSGDVEIRIEIDGHDGERWHHATMTNLLDDPDVQGVMLTLRDVHERHLIERELRFKATHDALTTLPDRAALQSRLEAILQEADAELERTALMFCDVDNFKRINDGAGHRVGDLVLTEVATRLRSALRSSDFVGRFGGDEFVVVAPNVDDELHAMALAERVFSAVTGPARCDGIEVDIALSMGVALSDEQCTTAAGLLHRADQAMYAAKRDGRGRVSLHRAGPGSAPTTVDTLRNDLRSAISARQLTLHYQPIVPLKEGLPPGFESLARWEHPEHGMVDARRFMALAESDGLMSQLGDELARVVCEDQQVWFGGDDGFVCINLSSSQLNHPDAAAAFLDRWRSHGADPRRVVIELTESAFGQGPVVRSNLEAFRSAKARLFLDDFGVGYSSLSHLHQFPVDGIKIDASIVNPTVDVELVRLILGVARTLDIRTIAEGVETDDQLATVTYLGVDYAQGHLLGRPARHPARPPEP